MNKVLLIPLIWLICVSMPLLAEDAAEPASEVPSLETCIARLRAWRESWATIQIRAREWNVKELAKTHPESDPDDPHFIDKWAPHTEFDWADWGAMRFASIIRKNGKPDYISDVGTDGIRTWGSNTEMGNASVIKTVQFFQPVENRPLSCNIAVVPLMGLWGSKQGQWIDEWLATDNWVVKGIEEIDGIPCVRIDWHVERYGHWLWLDPQAGFLPRQFTTIGRPHELHPRPRTLADPATGEKTWVVFKNWHVDEIKEVDGVLFPARGTDRDPENEEHYLVDWEITNIILNEPLDRTHFSAPQGTPRVTGFIDYQNGNAWRNSGNQSDGSASSAPSPPRGRGPTASAVAEKINWSLVCVVVGVVCLVVASVMARRRKSPST